MCRDTVLPTSRSSKPPATLGCGPVYQKAKEPYLPTSGWTTAQDLLGLNPAHQEAIISYETPGPGSICQWVGTSPGSSEPYHSPSVG